MRTETDKRWRSLDRARRQRLRVNIEFKCRAFCRALFTKSHYVRISFETQIKYTRNINNRYRRNVIKLVRFADFSFCADFPSGFTKGISSACHCRGFDFVVFKRLLVVLRYTFLVAIASSMRLSVSWVQYLLNVPLKTDKFRFPHHQKSRRTKTTNRLRKREQIF